MSYFSTRLKPILGFDIGKLHPVLLIPCTLVFSACLYFMRVDQVAIIKGVKIDSDSPVYWFWFAIVAVGFFVTGIEALFRLFQKLLNK